MGPFFLEKYRACLSPLNLLHLTRCTFGKFASLSHPRPAFWQKLPERLARLSNRVDAAMQATILSKVHERIPMVSADEQRSLQLENAKADEGFPFGSSV